jgi:hypothetical protein
MTPDELTQALADVDEYVMLQLARREDISDHYKIELTDEWNALYHRLNEAIGERGNADFDKGWNAAVAKSDWVD